MAESSLAQMSFLNQACERWIGSLHADSQVTEAIDDSWLGVSTATAAMSGGCMFGKRGADSPSQEDGPSKRRKDVRVMSEGLLNSISVRAAHAINMALAPGAEPLLRGQSSLVFPRFSQSSKSPHYDLPVESRSARRGQKRVLFPFAGGASLGLGLAGAVDLTEPLFDDFPQDYDNLKSNTCKRQSSVAVCVNTADTEKVSKSVYDMNNNVVDPRHWVTSPCGIAGCTPNDKYEDLLEFGDNASTLDFSCHESAIELLGTDLLKREPKPCPTSAFQLFTFKVQPLLRMPEEEAKDAVRSAWDQLPTTDKYAFEMQTFALRDSYNYALVAFVDTMPEATRKIYLRLRRRMHEKFFGFDIYKGYEGEGANGDACPMEDSSYGVSKLPLTPGTYRDCNNNNCINNGNVVSDQNGRNKHGNTNFNNSGHFYWPLNFDTSISTAQNNKPNLNVEPFNTSFDHHADKRNNACTSLSDQVASFSSASWHSDEELDAFDEWYFVEEDVTQEFDSDSDDDSSQTSTVTSVVMRSVRN